MKKREYHGMTNSREYKIWASMITRCHNPKSTSYKNYGGRGIQVCQEWRGSFLAFFRELGYSPSPKHTIDRIDNTRGYESGNIRWVSSRREQMRNGRRTHMITFRGETRCLEDWAIKLGIPRPTLSYRIHRSWSLERALTEPINKHPEFKRYPYNGQFLLFSELAHVLGINRNTLEWRLRNWPYEKVVNTPLNSAKSPNCNRHRNLPR